MRSTTRLHLSNRLRLAFVAVFFFFNDTATTEIYTLSLHDALPILAYAYVFSDNFLVQGNYLVNGFIAPGRDRKSTRLNSSHVRISYAVFCLKKKKDALGDLSLEINALAGMLQGQRAGTLEASALLE